ncbi:calcium-binding protein NCSA [Halyomorpha halys]|uniref:calcium-binding protein NCSA n=1 Tax=Halyomorpha halys TaxID=286706 RepID=UPI000D0C8A8A|nr:calcium-binding protein NCSA-like [Halyomorpha halys]
MVLHFDKTLTSSVDARKRLVISKHFSYLKGKTHFDDYELKCMLLLYDKLSPKKVMRKADFFQALRVMVGVTEEPILERLYCSLELPSMHGIMFDQWVSLLSLYSRGTLDEKIVFTFMVFDTMGTGHMTRSTVEELVSNQLGKQYGNVSDEQNRFYINMVFSTLDEDGDGIISWEDYRNTISKHPPLINCLGRVIPEQNIMDVFLTTFSRNVGPKYTLMYMKGMVRKPGTRSFITGKSKAN